MSEWSALPSHSPFVLSLSKDCFFFVRSRARPGEQEQCFDKLNTNGIVRGERL